MFTPVENNPYSMDAIARSHGIVMKVPPTIRRNGKESYDAGRSWGSVLVEPSILNYDHMDREIGKMDKTVCNPVYADIGGVKKELPNFKAITNARTGDVYSVMSDQYVPTDEATVFENVRDTLKSAGLMPIGRIDGIGSGKLWGHLFFSNPEATFKMGGWGGDADMSILGMRIWNSHKGDSSFGAEVVGVRYVCGNYWVMGNVLGKMRVKHDQKINYDNLNKMFVSAIDKVDVLADRMHSLMDEVLSEADSKAILYTTGLTPNQVDSILYHLDALVPEIEGNTAYRLFNGATAYITHKFNSANSYERTFALSDKVSMMLSKDIDKLIVEGNERIDALKEKSETKVAKKAKEDAEVRARLIEIIGA